MLLFADAWRFEEHYIGFSCWLVDCKLWVLVVVWGIKFVVSVVSDSRPSGSDLHR